MIQNTKSWRLANSAIKGEAASWNPSCQSVGWPLAKELDAISILSEDKAISISELAGLIKRSKFVIANDTGPAHMAAHLNVKGLSLFGSHTTAHKVSIERENIKAIQVSDLKNLSAEKVFERLVL